METANGEKLLPPQVCCRTKKDGHGYKKSSEIR